MSDPGWLGAQRVELDTCTSTNDEAARLGRSGACHGLVVTAAHQSAGRGRRARQWHSPAGENLYLSCLLRPEIAPRQVPPVALAAGLAVGDAVATFGLETALKWPNDVLVGGAKLAGVLAEMSCTQSRVDFVVVGIGLNVGSCIFPEGLRTPATSLVLQGLTGAATSLSVVTERLLGALEHRIDAYVRDGVSAFAQDWNSRACRGTLRVELDGNWLTGTCVGLDDDGALLLRTSSGQRHRIVAGEIELLQ